MATIHGVGGAAAATGFNMKASAWTGDTIIESVDTTGFADNGYRVREGTVVSMDGTIVGTAVDTGVPIPAAVLAATADPDSAVVANTLTGNASHAYSFNALMNNINHNRPFDGKYDLVFSYQSSGAITQTWV